MYSRALGRLLLLFTLILAGSLLWLTDHAPPAKAQSVLLYTLECAEDYPSGVNDLPNSCDNTDGFDTDVEGFSGWARAFYWKESLAWPQQLGPQLGRRPS